MAPVRQSGVVMPVETFYTVVGGIAFTLHGLWWVVVSSRREWQQKPARRALAYAVALHLLLLGMMSILSLVAPDQPLVWRAIFSLSGAIGVVGVLLLERAIREDHDRPRLAMAIGWCILPLYVVITILALLPTIPASLGMSLSAIQVEAIIVSLLLFLGVQAAWILMVEPQRPTLADEGMATDDGARRDR
jgi:hypothetical protein